MQCWPRELYNTQMILIDTHTHLYLPHFRDDIEQVIKNAKDHNVVKMLLPNIDHSTIRSMLDVCTRFPSQCHPMLGLHPTSVTEDYATQLSLIRSTGQNEKFVAIGETGMDAYWDKSYLIQQENAFVTQIGWAKEMDLPIVIHSRDTMDIVLEILKTHAGGNLRGVLHAFSGTASQAGAAAGLGFRIGLGGVITYKNSGLEPVIEAIDMKSIILETDSPYLTPAPNRGKRNESANLVHIVRKLAEIKGITIEEAAEITSSNAIDLFKLKINTS
jgi:TatD DNase family protein